MIREQAERPRADETAVGVPGRVASGLRLFFAGLSLVGSRERRQCQHRDTNEGNKSQHCELQGWCPIAPNRHGAYSPADVWELLDYTTRHRSGQVQAWVFK